MLVCWELCMANVTVFLVVVKRLSFWFQRGNSWQNTFWANAS